MEIFITSISAGSDREVVVTAEQREGEKRNTERFLLPISVYASLSLTVGVSDTDTFELLEREAYIYGAYKHSLYLLGISSQSKHMLYRKLVMKGFEPEISREAVDRLERASLLDEDSFAAREAEKCLDKHWGEARIRSHLYDKGYREKAIANAFFALEDNGVDFDSVCLELLEKKAPQLPKDKKELQKLIASMQRYGFSLSQIKRAIAMKR